MRLFFLFLLFPIAAGAQNITKNAYVGAKVSGGYVTIYKGDPAKNEQLTFYDKSYLTLEVNGRYYSNNEVGGKLGPSGTPQPIDVTLTNDQTGKIGDTIRTLWKEDGFDIIQNVYPVQFSNSGVIVLSVKVVNHTGIPLNTQAEFLLDNMNSNTTGGPDSSNDNPFLIHRYGFIRNWQDCPPSPLPSFFLAFEHPTTDSVLGTVGIGYVNDSFPPRPLGLLPLSLVEFGDWPSQVGYTWGPTNSGDQREFTDEAALLMGNPMSANGFIKGVSDSVTEIFRTAYGTPEWCYDHGNVFGFALYPHHVYWDPKSQTYSPNPFQVETFLFNVQPGAMSHTAIEQSVGDPVRIIDPKPTGIAKDTAQMQSVPGISQGNFADFHWTDSVEVLPTGCAQTFPVDINFNVTAPGLPSPIFYDPWSCSITVDCANPDTLPPFFQNSFSGCDSIKNDTVSVTDNGPFDLGLQNITWSSTDMKPAQYSVTLSSQPPFSCVKNAVKIFVHQVDTFQHGHVVLTFTDCANNISYDTLCFTAHPPLPDRTAPIFYSDNSDCHSRCKTITITDSAKSATSIDRGIDSIVVFSSTNMTLAGLPSGGVYPSDTPVTSLTACVTDSMQNGQIILRANDTTHNFAFDTIAYCTTPDTLAPIITASALDAATGSWRVHISEIRPWDRGIDSVWIESANNVTTVPSPIPTLACVQTYDLDVHILDTSFCASAMVFARDCAGDSAGPFPVSYTKGTKPVITASKLILCSVTDSAVLDAGPNYTGYRWSTKDTTRIIVVHAAGNYFVTVQEGDGCPATSDPVTVALSPVSPAIVPGGPFTLCAPDSVKLDAGSGYATYQWSKDGIAIPGATSETIEASASGSYTAAVTNAAGCAGTSTPVMVTIDPVPPQPVITASNNVLASSPASTYQWSLDGTPIPGATGQTFTPTSGGTFTVTITDAAGCSNTSEPFSNAGSTVVAVDSATAQESQHVSIALRIVTSQDMPQGVTRTFTALIRFNKTLLVPDPGTFVSDQVQGSDLVVKYSGQTSTTLGPLMMLPFTAALGNDSCTAITIDSFSWDTPNLTITKRDGNFCLTGLCEQGGARLIDPDGVASISAPSPNPAFTTIQLGYTLIEHGPTSLVIYDLLGHEALRLMDAVQEPGSYQLTADISLLPAGNYICTLRTPTIVQSQPLQIVR